MDLSRRDLLKQGTLATGLLAVGNVAALFTASPAAARGELLGPVVPDSAGLLDLPAGFRYTVLSREGDPLPRGGTVPGRFDGGAAFTGPGGRTVYVRNHELVAGAPSPVLGEPRTAYDRVAAGGTTTLVMKDETRLVDEYVSLSGTVKNCAGGVTPWGTWLSCEETDELAGGPYSRDHGYVFEVDPNKPGHNTAPTPLVAMGRFQHEAVAVDPRSGIAYLTEDDTGPLGLLYRFMPAGRPRKYGDYRRGGQLFAMRCSDRGVPVPDLSPYALVGTTLQVDWVPVPDPDGKALGPVRAQFDSLGVAGTPGGAITRARKLEGMWWSEREQLVHLVSSYARPGDGSLAGHDGQVWSYDPTTSQLRLEIRFEYNPLPDQVERANGPDNITVTPWGGLLLAEDEAGTKHLYLADREGNVTQFARNAASESEMAGVCFSPSGRTLYASIYSPGITFAITGPFERFHAPKR